MNKISVFTKPWRTQSVSELIEIVKGMGFDGVEFPLRDGYQAEPKDAVASLPKLAEEMRKNGLEIYSVASGLNENIFEACAIAKVPLIRVMAGYEGGIKNGEEKVRKMLYAAEPFCEKYGIKVGVQHHQGHYSVSSSMELLHLLEPTNPEHFGAIWDAAHSALSGEYPDQALEILKDRLFLVNFKAAYYLRTNGPDAEYAKYTPYFTTARHCQMPWISACNYLKSINYDGVVCMPAEYTDDTNLIEKTTTDLNYLKSLL